MSESFLFLPPRRAGIVFHTLLLLALLAACLWGLWQAAHARVGPSFLRALLPALLALILIPWLAYRLYSLRNARYVLERDGIRLIWGLRMEVIPMDEVVQLGTSEALGYRLPLPWLRWPGAVLGTRRLPDGKRVEFLAAASRHLVLISTPQGAYAISPENAEAFLQAFQHLMELGSLSPLSAQSVYPTFLLARVWKAPLPRALLLSGGILNLVLLALTSLAVPTHSQVTLGFGPGREPVPSMRLLLLVFLSGAAFLADLLLGLFFYRRPEGTSGVGSTTGLISGELLAYLLWGSATLTSALFILALMYILAA